MTTLYYAVNLETDEAYELGRGNWYAIRDRMITGPNLCDAILDVLQSSFTKLEDPLSYAQKVSAEITSLWGEGKTLVLESDDDIFSRKQVGSRYKK